VTDGSEHVCSELRAERLLIWCPKNPAVYSDDRHPLYSNHRAYKIVARGDGGRPAFAMVEKPWRTIDRSALHQATLPP